MQVKWIIFSLCFLTTLQAAEELPREVLALYWKGPVQENENPENQSSIEMYVEMAMNHLGLVVTPHDLRKGKPDFGMYRNLRGIILWLEDSLDAPYLDEMIEEMTQLIDQGVKFVSLGEIGLPSNDPLQYYAGVQRVNRLLGKIGLNYKGQWISKTYEMMYDVKNTFVVNFEKDLSDANVPYMVVKPTSSETEVYAWVQQKDNNDTRASVISVHPNGGMIAPWHYIYEAFDTKDGREIRSLYVNPFAYFMKVFSTQNLPKPDTTTLCGRRMYYSQIDGDGWYNLSLIPGFYNRGDNSAKVILEEIIKKNRDLPVSVGVIGAELDTSWVARKEGIEVAREMFTYPHVEPSTHTFTHPFFWQFFENYTPEKEEPYLPRYPDGGWVEKKGKALSLWERFLRVVHKQSGTTEEVATLDDQSADSPEGYLIPRYYAKQPFDLNLEIRGAIDILQTVTPHGEKAKVYQWSGNCQPFEKAVELTYLSGVPNINGGDTRFDGEYPSYAWVSPVGRLVGMQRQVYASMSNENLYTNLWQDAFFGFKDLPETIRNTEFPYRLKPINLYYHTYSGERLSSLRALKSNLSYIRTQKICPVETSYFARLGQGFYTTRIIDLGERRYRIEDRGDLQTIRFDEALLDEVDFTHSEGVLGQRHLHGSLYISLDESVPVCVIALKSVKVLGEEDWEGVPYLVESQWRIYSWDVEGFSFLARGYGEGEMVWSVPLDGKYSISFSNESHEGKLEAEAFEHRLEFRLPPVAMTEETRVVVQRK